jgi:DNA-binding MarR family transcriptional regulator
MRHAYGVTRQQLAMLRIVQEMQPVTIAELRARLVLHPATLGQLLDRLAEKRLLHVATDKSDRRRRVVSSTPKGRELVSEAPLAGPVRLRSIRTGGSRLNRIADSLEDAIDLFGVRRWA